VARENWLLPSPYTASGLSPAKPAVPKSIRAITAKTIERVFRMFISYAPQFFRYSSLRIAGVIRKFQGFFVTFF
jgi:hypothetical protein